MITGAAGRSGRGGGGGEGAGGGGQGRGGGGGGGGAGRGQSGRVRASSVRSRWTRKKTQYSAAASTKPTSNARSPSEELVRATKPTNGCWFENSRIDTAPATSIDTQPAQGLCPVSK